jgi:hypothetical protein
MVTHDNDLANRAPRTITLADGEIVNEKQLIGITPQNGNSQSRPPKNGKVDSAEKLVNHR